MKCIQCQTDNTLQDRTSNYGRCKQCGHAFVFEPTSMGTVKTTDGMFAKAIADLSANDTLYFTPKQLFYLLDKRLQSKTVYGAIGLLVLDGILTFFLTVVVVLPNLSESWLGFLLLPGIVNLIFFVLIFRYSKKPVHSIKARQIAARCLQVQAIALAILGIWIGLATDQFWLFGLGGVIGIWGFYLGARQHATQRNTAQSTLLDMETFDYWLTRWQQINAIATILPAPKESSLPATINPDVTAYSFDRLVVTDTAAIAQLLIANNFHFEHNCAILSITGYPQSIFQTTMDMLRRNPDLKVYAFHDCSGQGLSLVHHLQTSPHWFANSEIEIVDVGLRPRQVMSLKNVVVQQSTALAQAAQQLPTPIRQSLSPDEQQWLDEGNGVLLESFSPQRLIQALQRGISTNRGALEAEGDGMIWLGDSGSSYYTVESFG